MGRRAPPRADAPRTAASLLGWLYEDLSDAQVQRACTYDLPDPTAVDVGWLLVHTAHEVVHHLDDVERESKP